MAIRRPSCSIWFLAARTDMPFMMQTIPHIVKMCNYPFSQKVLAVDTSQLSGDYISRPCIGTLAELKECCDSLLASGVIDKVVDIDFSEDYQKRVYTKHLGRFIPQTHNFRGAPILGYVFLLEQADSDYLVHFNTDMLIYQNASYNWIEEGITTLRRYQEIVCVTPLSGPPTEDGSLHQNVLYDRDPRGFYRFKQFTSRKFLINIKRFERLLPLRIMWNTKEQHSDMPYPPPRTKGPFPAGGGIDRWENMISNRLRETRYFRVDLDTRSAWALHSSQNHGRDFVENLPHIIERIESGRYPPEQAGHYNLHLGSWLKAGR